MQRGENTMPRAARKVRSKKLRNVRKISCEMDKRVQAGTSEKKKLDYQIIKYH